jgi:sec-independent protein translocase protein TatB
MGTSEMLFIFLLALIVFGPKKLPEIGRQIGKALAEFKRASNEFKSQLEAEMRQIEIEEDLKKEKETLTPTLLPPESTIASGMVVGEAEFAADGAALHPGEPQIHPVSSGYEPSSASSHSAFQEAAPTPSILPPEGTAGNGNGAAAGPVSATDSQPHTVDPGNHPGDPNFQSSGVSSDPAGEVAVKSEVAQGGNA